MGARILVVDDEPQFERLILQRFRQKIRGGTFSFVFALNGVEALEIIEKDAAIDMVLTDINMPGMDGLTLTSKIQQQYPHLKTIIISAYGDMRNIRKAMNLGAFDFITKPIDFTDLQKTIDKTLLELEFVAKAEQVRELEKRNARLREIATLKNEFFTNISHELRTPLTVISGMADQVRENPAVWLDKGIRMIKRNANTLLNLVNQILDLRKVQAGKMKVTVVHDDIIPFLQYIFESFELLADSRDIQTHFLANVSDLVMDYDPEKLTRILSNLLDNAVKYTDGGGQVYLLVDHLGDWLQIRAKDTGHGIADEKISMLFSRFFQAEEMSGVNMKGSGIGLSLARELARLMGGDIKVESKAGKGSTFTVSLPVRLSGDMLIKQGTPFQKSHEWLEDIVSFNRLIPEAGDPGLEKASMAQLPEVLIMEDNEDVASYLKACLHGLYRVDWVPDGDNGIKRAMETVPDIIISDLMMPHKNGYEICRILKNDIRTSHIPIILLTAKTDTESRIMGFEKGADAYLAKPFDKRELLVRIEQLRTLRNNLQQRFQSLATTGSAGKKWRQPEDQFIQQLKTTIENNLENESFGILQLCRAAGMSRTQLHRKVKALTGRSTSGFIRSIRLHKAVELLKNTDLNISQVAYEVGFKDPKYFSRTFANEFGTPPRQLRV